MLSSFLVRFLPPSIKIPPVKFPIPHWGKFPPTLSTTLGMEERQMSVYGFRIAVVVQISKSGNILFKAKLYIIKKNNKFLSRAK